MGFNKSDHKAPLRGERSDSFYSYNLYDCPYMDIGDCLLFIFHPVGVLCDGTGSSEN